MSQARPLRPLGGWDLVSRGRFEARHDGHVWTVDLDYFDFGEKLHLYRDGVEVEVQKSPAMFELGQSATIEASMGLLGMRQVDLVVEGETTMLTPVDGTAEAWRLQLARERPETSRLIGALSWAVLVVALVYEVPQLVALIGSALGADFEPPFTLPGVANFALASRRSPPRWSELCDSRATAGSGNEGDVPAPRAGSAAATRSDKSDAAHAR